MTWATRVEIETVLRISAAAFLNLNQRFRFKSNAFWNLNKFKYFPKNRNLRLLNQNNFEIQFII
jgi:hypothetical protein